MSDDLIKMRAGLDQIDARNREAVREMGAPVACTMVGRLLDAVISKDEGAVEAAWQDAKPSLRRMFMGLAAEALIRAFMDACDADPDFARAAEDGGDDEG